MLHQRARDHRKGADDGRLVRKAGFRAQPGDGRPKAVDDRQSAGDAEQIRQPGKGEFAPRPECSPHGGFADRLAGAAAPEPRSDTLKTGLASEVADALAGNDEFAALAVDMAQHGFGGRNAIQADRGL